MLIVEDNNGDVALLRQSLRDYAVAVNIVVMTDGEKAIRYLDAIETGSAPCPDLVVLDLNLPKRTGRDVLRHIRRSTTCGHVPVAVFSSSDAATDKEDAARLGANRYITKPTDLDAFLKIGGTLIEMLQQ